MKDKLRMACINFDWACSKRLEEKEEQGLNGWDNKELKAVFTKRICQMDFPFTQKDLVDMSNYCNFLWNLIEARK